MECWFYHSKIYREGTLYQTYKLTAGSELPELPLPPTGYENVYASPLPEVMPGEDAEIWITYKLAPLNFTYITPDVEKEYDGNEITLSVTVEHALDTITYTWYRNGTLVGGASGSSLTVSGDCTSAEGDSYRCVVILADGTQMTQKEHSFTVKITEPAPIPEPEPEPTPEPTPEPEPNPETQPDSSISNVGGSDAPESDEGYNFSGIIIIGMSLGLIVLMSIMQVRKERR